MRKLLHASSCLLFFALAVTAHAADPVTLNWLGATAPAAPVGVSWGIPWPKGAIQPNTPMRLTTATGTSLPLQTWPVAYWPDGSVKWSGHALAATSGLAGPFTLTPLANAEAPPAVALKCLDDSAAISITNGPIRVSIPKRGADLIESLIVGQRIVAQHGRLVARIETSTKAKTSTLTRETELIGVVESAVLEQNGPVRAVVKLTGKHRPAATELARPEQRDGWLPFTIRLHFFAGSSAIKLTHSFVYDGDPRQDFIKGLGLTFDIPFAEEPHNRHIRFVGDNSTEPNLAPDSTTGVWAQPVRMLPGYRPSAGREIADAYADHLAGKRVSNLAEFDPRTRNALLTVPVWADAKLTQLAPNNFSLFKRTSSDASWLHVTDGHRAQGLAVLADVSGGLALGVKDFWQKSPATFEITGAGHTATSVAPAVGHLTAWFWSPDAPAMDLRRYDETPHGLAINYEDWKPGWGTPVGVANTHDVTLWALDRVPSHAELLARARAAAAPPILVCTPEYYHAQQVGGRWSLPQRTTPASRWIEDQLETFVNYYRDQVDERSWYGFWDFGDIMHNYDFGRHEWRYDVGGWAWANTELMPDMLLWYSFLRTGRADVFRFAEAMTRHTSEVDVHHTGPFAPLGSRHNVNHWGDGAKQPRVSHAGLKRTYYFLTGGDGRVGDLLREQVDADLAYGYLAGFNAAHYIPGTADAAGNITGEPRPDGPRAIAAPRPENFALRPTAASRQPFTRFGLEWMCYALNWTTEWERGVDPSWRPRLEADMRTMAANVDAQGRFPGRYFDMIFGGPENMWEMEPMYDLPEFWRAWANTAEAVGRQVDGGQMTGPRMLAYAAHVKKSPELGLLAWQKLLGPAGQLPPLNRPQHVASPGLLRPVTDPSFLGANVGWQLHGVASVQWALNAIETLEFAAPWLPLWEKAP